MEGLLASAASKVQKALKSVKPVVHCPIVMHRYEGMGTGLRAAASIPKDSVILQVTENVSSSNLKHLDILKQAFTTPVLNFAEETTLQGKPESVKRMRVALQISNILRDRMNPMFDYIDMLPLENLPFPVYWRTPGASFSVRMREVVLETATEARAVYDKLYNSENRIITSVTWEEFLWTHYMAWSRCVETDGHMHLVPLIDFVNHSFTEANCAVDKKDDLWRLVATRDIAPDTQLLRNYGPLDSYQYMNRWGFFQPGNPHHNFYAQLDQHPEWELMTKLAKISDKSPLTELANPQELSMMQLKKKLLQKHGLSLMACPISLSPPAEKMESTLRMLYLQPEEMLDAGMKSVEDVLERMDFTKAVSAKNEKRMHITAVKLCSFFLSTFSEDWKAEVPMCKELEDEEKDILQRARDYYMSKQRVSISAPRD